MGDIIFYAESGKVRTCQSNFFKEYNDGGNFQRGMAGSYWNDTTTNLTSLVFQTYLTSPPQPLSGVVMLSKLNPYYADDL
jgi:hypothetical protein